MAVLRKTKHALTLRSHRNSCRTRGIHASQFFKIVKYALHKNWIFSPLTMMKDYPIITQSFKHKSTQINTNQRK